MTPLDDDDPGILASIPGQYVAAATLRLPEAVAFQWKTPVSTWLDVPGIGRVGFTAESMISKHGRSTHYYWSVKRAVLIDKTR